MTSNESRADQVRSDTLRWLERAVIGLNLCPFAKSVYVKNQVHLRVSEATVQDELLQVLADELNALAASEPQERDTTMLVFSEGLADFLDYNDFLGLADNLLVDLGFDGVLQIASLHPQYQFAGTTVDDVTNHTNQSPYPTLHLLREESIDRAVEAFPEAESIYERNMELMRRLGEAGWRELDVGAHGGGV